VRHEAYNFTFWLVIAAGAALFVAAMVTLRRRR
jgi:hypothetical protein